MCTFNSYLCLLCGNSQQTKGNFSKRNSQGFESLHFQDPPPHQTNTHQRNGFFLDTNLSYSYCRQQCLYQIRKYFKNVTLRRAWLHIYNTSKKVLKPRKTCFGDQDRAHFTSQSLDLNLDSKLNDSLFLWIFVNNYKPSCFKYKNIPFCSASTRQSEVTLSLI